MAGIALILFCEEETGSYAVAGAVSAAFAAGAGVGGQFWSRAIDRRGRGLLAGLAVAHAAAVVVLFLAVLDDAPSAALLACSAIAGGFYPPLAAVSRSMWPRLLAGRPELLSTALAVESVLIELIFTAGPLAVVLIGALTTPGAALLLGAGLVVCGVLVFLARVPALPDRSGERSWLGALASPGLATVVMATVPLGMCFGAVEVALPAFADAEGHSGLAGVPVAVWAVGSACSGIAYGTVTWRTASGRRFMRFVVALPLAYAILPAAPGFAGLLVLAFVAGVAIAPTVTAALEVAGERAPPGTETEAMAWPITALVIGIAGGNVAAGQVVEAAGAREALGAAVLGAGLAALVALTRRRTLLQPG